ncbi:uncharacterized protein NECHADRAFT_83480 [Fusarium vanettenii 77-13-4]|uniref:Major facilitator superfamily (MFS) profile domain-containing protein n=1 Tax=Fusarium vanettenii (strain ATCC MYA-4622 / CBS 123669 / FGSC 9596 / NRRL 45880 / 77-13-4) TaxID=660122 RepID=C7Z449_FUSV7|nr:uncharacterized protein NECHADRAFT_83480 [Fusarium vanettenii 77-13-4]EEU41255.1 hypothetical protein NECHADRAFT_83480 [Fusarium vanettenii 77-13-4]
MVKDMKPTANDNEVAQILTLIFSAYSFAQFATNLLWGRVSDSIGRRPVVLIGLASTCVSMLGLGLSRSIPAMFVFRVMAGSLSGNIVIVRTVIGEIVHGRENKARAFVWNQTVYQVGSVLGPLVGGYLAQPCRQFPEMCDANSLLYTYPFALPNLALSAMAALSFAVAFFLVEESLEKPDDRKIMGGEDDESTALLSAHEPPRSPSFRDAISSKVIHVVLSYALMALHTICFDQIFPVFMVTSRAASHPPFYLDGGLGFESSLAASLISAAGIVFVCLMITVFPVVDRWLGSLLCLQGSVMIYPITYLLLPYLSVLPASPAWIPITGASTILLAKAVAAVFSFNENSVLLSMASPSRNTLGIVNGIGQTAAAGARALGPAAMGIFIGLGDRVGSGALGWWFLAAVAAVGALQGLWVVDEPDEPSNEADSA